MEAEGVVEIVPAVTDRLAIVPRLVSDEPVTPAAKVLPDSVPAGAMTAAVVMLVVKPLAFIVTTGIAVLEPVTPAVATVAKVVAFPTEVTSPVKLALVVTFPAVRPEAVPVTLVIIPEAGVPKAGAVITGLVSVLLVSVSVVSLPTKVVVASGKVTTRPAVATASSKVIVLAALAELRNRMPLLLSRPSLIVTSPVPLGWMCIPVFALEPSA